MRQFRNFYFSLFLFLFPFQSVFAATGDIEGWAWGGGAANTRGMGWISMNSSDCDTDGNGLIDNLSCGVIGLPIPTYAVNVPMTDGNLSGYAWSEHYGWISFNASDAAGCPSGTCPARRVGDSILGWARTLSIRDAGVNAGGWQGWINLNSANSVGGSSYGLEILKMTKRISAGYPDTTCITNPIACTYAYSDELGWIDFSLAGYSADYRICPSNLTITEGMNASLHAYYNANGLVDCLNLTGATDVTNLVTWNSSIPGVATVGAGTGLVTGIMAGSSIVTSSNYSGKTAPSVPVSVVCASDYAALCAAASPAECPTVTIEIIDRCGTTTNTCTGTRNCDFNWKEIAP